MRAHFLSIATTFVALLFVSGTVGCRSNGGDWYNPKSYAFTNPFADVKNPFAKDNQAPPYSTDALANSKPSADSQPRVGLSNPSVSTPVGGYTDEGVASRAGSIGGTASQSQPEHWGQHNPVAQYGASNDLGGYSVPESSQYSPYPDYARQGTAPASYQSAPQHNPYLYQPETAHHASNPMPYGNDYLQPYQPTSVYTSQQPMHSNPAGAYGVPGQPGSYSPYGNTPYTDPYASIHQPPASSPVPGYEQPTPAPFTGYPGEGTPPVGSPYQPHQPPVVSGGHNYSY